MQLNNSEFRSEPFRGREHNSEFLPRQQKIEIYSRNAGNQLRASILKLLRNPGIDSMESIPPACLARRTGTVTLFLLGS